MWRDLLSSSSSSQKEGAVHTEVQGRRKVAPEVFGECTLLTLGAEYGPKETVYWREDAITIESLSNPPPRLMRAILWELYEVGFRMELRALDQAIVPRLWKDHRALRIKMFDAIFPAVAGILFWNSAVPQRPGSIGLTDAVQDDEDFLRRWCFILSAWPDVPSCLESTPYLATADERRVWLHRQLSEACFFYVKTFYKYFGRPPLVPHRFPLDYHS